MPTQKFSYGHYCQLIDLEAEAQRHFRNTKKFYESISSEYAKNPSATNFNRLHEAALVHQESMVTQSQAMETTSSYLKKFELTSEQFQAYQSAHYETFKQLTL